MNAPSIGDDERNNPDIPPTFDDWYRAKHGAGWDERNTMRLVGDALQDLAAHLREYATLCGRWGRQ